MAFRTPVEIEDVIIRKILQVSLVDPMLSHSQDAYLERMAAEISSAGKDLLLSRDLMENAVQQRLFASFPPSETPFHYFLNSYRRACEEEKKTDSMNMALRSEMQLVLRHAKKLLVTYCRWYACSTSMKSRENSSVSVLLPFILAEVGGFDGSGSSSSGVPPIGFVDYFLMGAEYDSIQPILKQLYEKLSRRVLKLSIIGNFEQPLKALQWLVKYPVGAKALVCHPWWIPNGNGRDIEMNSILGPYFRLSALPDHVCFIRHPQISQRDLGEHYGTIIRRNTNNLWDGLAKVLKCLLNNTETREDVLEYLAKVINKNASRGCSQVDPLSCASPGMFVNLSAVMLRLCEPLMNPRVNNIDKIIDPTYVFYGNRLELSELTALHASPKEVDASPISTSGGQNLVIQSQEASSSSSSANEPVNRTYPVLCECFFMTARVLKLGLIKSLSEMVDFTKLIEQHEVDLSSKKVMQEQAPSPKMLQEITLLKNKIDSWRDRVFRCRVQILDDERFIRYVLSYYHVMVVWLVGLVGGCKMPLPPTCPKEFACMPEHFVEDIISMSFLAILHPKALDHGVILDDFMSFMIMFMASPGYILKQSLRLRMVELLSLWISCSRDLESTITLFEKNKLSLELVKNLLKLFGDEYSNQPSVKYSHRLRIAKFLEFLGRLPSYRNVWGKIAEDKGVYLNFCKVLIDDTKVLVDQSLNEILELQDVEARTSTTDGVKRKSISFCMELANEYMKKLSFISGHIIAPFVLPEMVDKVAYVLKSFLSQLVEPQNNFFHLTNPEEFMFQPRQLLKQIIITYITLDNGDESGIFSEAISKAGGFPKEQLFSDNSVLRSISLEDALIVQAFEELGDKVNIATLDDLGMIPEEFVDPLLGHVMKDPVILPISQQRLDRWVIKQHLKDVSDRDPFVNLRMKIEEIVPDVVLKTEIDEWIMLQRLYKE